MLTAICLSARLLTESFGRASGQETRHLRPRPSPLPGTTPCRLAPVIGDPSYCPPNTANLPAFHATKLLGLRGVRAQLRRRSGRFLLQFRTLSNMSSLSDVIDKLTAKVRRDKDGNAATRWKWTAAGRSELTGGAQSAKV